MCPVTRPTTPPRILLVGMMGSGKSTIGRLLAERLHLPFSDNDQVLRQRAGGGPGAVFLTRGADALHSEEAAMLRDRVSAAGMGVINVPASAVLDPELRGRLPRAGAVVWLRGRPETLEGRLSGAGLDERPRFEHDVGAWLRAEVVARAPLYAEVADLTVDVDDLPPWRVAQQVLDGLSLPAFGWLPGSFQGVVLDLDGLLVDTEVIWQEAKRVLYAARGIPFNVEDHHAVLGTSEDYTVGVFARRFGLGTEQHPAILRDYLGHANELFAKGVPTRAGAMELVTSLRGRVPLGLASNTRREIVEDMLRRSGLAGCFDAIVTGDEAEPKPAAGIYLEACRQLGIEPDRSVAVEDSPTGVRAAKAAGLACIGVPSDPDHPLDGADRVAASLLELIPPNNPGSAGALA